MIGMHLSETLIGKSILVTGATGMLGSQLVKKIAIESNAKVIALYRNENKKNKIFTDLVGDNIEWICCDVTQPVDITSPIDYIIHTAGVTGGSKQHVDFPMRTIATAIDGTRNMLEIAREKKVSGFVFLSSLEIYGKTDYEIPSIQEDEGGYYDNELFMWAWKDKNFFERFLPDLKFPDTILRRINSCYFSSGG